MLLILEDNLDKLTLLLSRFRQRTSGKTILCADSVTKGQSLALSLLDGIPFELWLDSELNGSFGIQFLYWLIELNMKPSFVLITTMGPNAKRMMVERCVKFDIPHDSWAGPFG